MWEDSAPRRAPYKRFLSKLYPCCGAETHNPEIKGCTVYRLDQPGAPVELFFKTYKKYLIKVIQYF